MGCFLYVAKVSTDILWVWTIMTNDQNVVAQTKCPNILTYTLEY